MKEKVRRCLRLEMRSLSYLSHFSKFDLRVEQSFHVNTELVGFNNNALALDRATNTAEHE